MMNGKKTGWYTNKKQVIYQNKVIPTLLYGCEARVLNVAVWRIQEAAETEKSIDNMPMYLAPGPDS